MQSDILTLFVSFTGSVELRRVRKRCLFKYIYLIVLLNPDLSKREITAFGSTIPNTKIRIFLSL